MKLHKHIFFCYCFLIIYAPAVLSQIDFDANILEGCSPQVITFTANAPGANSFEWDLGNGVNSTSASPGVSYINPGLYTVSLKVFYPDGSSESMVKTDFIEIFSPPQAEFSANTFQICEGESILFQDVTIPGSNTLTQWLWDFGDGDTASTRNVQHTYDAAGTFAVTLIARDVKGCEDTEQKEAYIQVLPRPDASFVADNALGCAAPFGVNFFSTGSGSAFTHSWNLGNGQTSTQVNPSATYTQNGSYSVTHIVTNGLGCSDTVAKPDLVNVGNATVNVQVSDSIVCVGEEIEFFCGAGFGSIVAWDFGVPGGSSSNCNAVFTYRTPGIYTVQVTIQDPSGCSFVSSKQIRVSTPPIPNFSVAEPLLCNPPLTTSFVNNSQDAISYSWDFGDGQTSTDENPIHTYPTLPILSTAGQPYYYDVTLTAFNADGCPASRRINNAVVTGQTRANFLRAPAEGCAPLTVTLSDTSLSPSTVTSWFWDLGDGTTSTSPVVTHTYTDTGDYTVTLIIETVHGCTDTLVVPAGVRVGNTPTVDFVANPLVSCASTAVSFTNLSTNADRALWLFGDGNDSREWEPAHTYRDTGLMDVTLIVYNRGCPAMISKPEYVYINSPVARVEFPGLTGCGLPYTPSLTNTSIDAHRYIWYFGTGDTSHAINPIYSYTQEGFYDLSLVAYNDSTGCQDSVTFTVAVELIDPIMDVTVIGACDPVVAQFQDLTSNSISAVWAFGDGDSSYEKNPIHVYKDPGVYTARMRVMNSAGCLATARRTIQVSRPVINFSVLPSQRGCTPFDAQFVNQTFSPSPIASWEWTFGPAGATSTEENPMFLYQNPGFYTVSLIAADSLGCADTLTRRDYISVFQAIPAFSADEPINCINNPIVFLNTSQGSGLTYFWDFGDGNTSTAANPVHSYAANGVYDVSLTVTDFNGCDSTLQLPGYVTISDPVIALTADTTFADCPPLLVNFFAQAISAHTFTDWNWDFGDGANSTGIRPSHLYIESGSFGIELMGTTSSGCVANIIEPDFIQITGPQVDFSFGPGNVCPGEPISFVSQNVQNVSSFIWDLGNGTLDSGASIVYAYPDAGIYYPILIAEDNAGCQVVVQSPDSIIIYPEPIADFQISGGQLCGGDTLTLSDRSRSDNDLVSWEWDYGLGTTTLQNPVLIFNDPGIYDISLVVTNETGCRDTLVQAAAVTVESNIPPDPPEILYVSVLSDGEIEIVYEPFSNTFGDFDSYVVYRADASGTFTPIETIRTLQQTRMVDRGLDTRASSYCYKIQVVNECGTSSDLDASVSHCSILLETTAQPRHVAMNWSEYIGWPAIETYRVYKVQGYATGAAELLAILPYSVQSFEDYDVFCEAVQTYRIEARKANDSLISWSNIQVEAPLHEAPTEATHMRLATVMADSVVEIHWGNLPQIPFAKELVIEKNSGSGYVPAYRQSIDNPDAEWVDDRVSVDEQSYGYRAYVTDSCGTNTPIGRIARSIHLRASRRVGSIFLDWNPYQEWEMGVDMYRLEIFNDASQSYELLGLVGPGQTSYVDRETDWDQPNYCYRIIAEEAGGNQLESVSNVVCVPVGPQIYYPNAFTPNGDQNNEEFIISGIFIREASLQIFNRWGEKLYEGTKLAWDGKYKGKIVPEGVYVFRVEGIGVDGTPFAQLGTVTLIR